MKVTLGDLAEHITDLADELVPGGISIVKDEMIVHTEPQHIVSLMSMLQTDANCLFKVLVDITAVDYPDRDKRFEVVYHLLSVRWNRRVRVKCLVDEDTPIPTIVPMFAAAGWFERETWDMYGIFFSGNPDLRRILTDYGFDGHPLRKDFPLTGYVELRYDEEQKRVVYQPVDLVQDFRNFDALSPWEGPGKYILPGDEKATDKKA